ncbi:DUF6460 domain-containing protein [Devosia ginsengisoli]|uniref:Integrase n=1 Tax=Devosia ginsengisoli TaxID=400770 RepID=A0A5B8LXB0_9HYPH|nr:DUF6460 domain-containing protein [Devosia ginsengisoli]QDZ13088.1 integrase [Devosia ginsengisoli]
MADQHQTETRRSGIERFFGGHPINVIIKLAFISLLVGVFMSVFGLDVQGLVRGTVILFREALRDGFGVFRDIGGYILTGAALVVPIWLLIRVSKRS